MTAFGSARGARQSAGIELPPSSSLGVTDVDDIDNQLRKLFDAAASELDVPVEDIVEAGTRLGRKRRARRNTGMVAAVVGVVGLTAGAVFGVQRFGIGSAPSNASAAAGRQTTDQRVSVSAVPSTGGALADTSAAGSSAGGAASSAAAAGGTTPVQPLASGLVRSNPESGPQVGAALLTQLVSADGLHAVRQNGTSVGVADLIYDDGHGQSEIMASVREYSAALKQWNAYTCVNFNSADAATRPYGVPEPSCMKVITTGGYAEYLMVTSDDGSGFYDYEVNLFTADNMVVALDAGNGVPQATTVDVTRKLPPLSLAEMQAIVADPSWLDYVDPAS
jgi:hypothetical protein